MHDKRKGIIRLLNELSNFEPFIKDLNSNFQCQFLFAKTFKSEWYINGEALFVADILLPKTGNTWEREELRFRIIKRIIKATERNQQ